MTNNPLVSIIIPVYKNVKWLPETINSVFNQNYKNYEIIVINDCSPENVKPFLLPYANNDKIRYYEHTVNKGPAGARNTGISKCSGEYILPLDSDDVIYDANFLVDSIKKINKNTIVTSQVCFCDESIKPKEQVWPDDKTDKTWSKIINTNNVIGSSMYSKSMWEKIGGYDEKILGYEDWEFWICAYKAGYKLIRINHAYIYYRIHNDNISLYQNTVKKETLKYIFDKHGSSER